MTQSNAGTELSPVLERIDNGLSDSLKRLFELLRIPSISTDPAYAEHCRKAAEWLVSDIESVGFEASVRDTPGHPMVVGHHEGATPDAPHLLFYGHYDVQPVDPLDLWDTDPFSPAIGESPDGQKIITGRGTADDKGQLMTFVEACRAWKAEHGTLPFGVTILFEGEEESGSPSLKPFLEANSDELKADLALVCDTSMWDRDTPAISTGLRGLVGEEITVRAADRDLHSGYYGGAAANPIHILAKVLADLHDEDGAVTIPGFYDGVEETPPDILAEWEKLGRSSENIPFGYRPVDPVWRKGPLDPRTDLGASDCRGQRDCRRLYRRGLQDGDRRQGISEGVLPPRRQAGSRRHPQEFPRIRPCEDPCRLFRRVPEAWRFAGNPVAL
jgi:acetylornithine deacetylase/succinyl-diaminopimelate desuccinylase-like protein